MNNDLYRNKYRIRSARLKEYDYSQDGWYFVTICTNNRQHYFGKIKGEEMILNDVGKIANEYWCEISKHFKFVRLDKYVIMPNHIHGIIVIDNDLDKRRSCRDVALLRLYNGDHRQMSKISPKSGSLSAIIRSYKSIVKRESKFINKNFTWQSRFYDHVIRNEKSLNKIRQYIIDNPAKWVTDRNNIYDK